MSDIRKAPTKQGARKTTSSNNNQTVSKQKQASASKKVSSNKKSTSKKQTKEMNQMGQKKQSKNRKQGKSKKRSFVLGIKVAIFIVLLAIVGAIVYFYAVYGETLFDYQREAKEVVMESTRDTFKSSQTSVVYDSNGDVMSTLKAEKDVYYVEYKDIPKAFINSMLVTEDRKFLSHKGVDYLANVRAAWMLVRNKGEIKQGASTITQQLARNIFLSHEVSYTRKIKEIFIAQELEKKYNKYDILEFYLNNIYFANGDYGIQAASSSYFGLDVEELSLSQIAFLCAIPNNPNLYNPFTNMENTLKRRDRILVQLRDEGMIEKKEYKKAIDEEIVLTKAKLEKNNYVETFIRYSATRALMEAQGFVFRNVFDSEAEKEAYNQEYDELYTQVQKRLFVSGYQIYTSINLKQQALLQKAVDDNLSAFTSQSEEGIYEMQGAAVSIDNDTGRVVAVVGGRDQEFDGYTMNRAYQSYRQPGSAIKPLIVYGPAFERGYHPETKVMDEKWEDGPKNSGNKYEGEITMQRAIEQSKNTIAWKTFEELTPTVGLSYLLRMNFNRIDRNDYYPASSLGGFTVGVSPLEMAAAYAAIENDGFYRNPTPIIKILDANGDMIVEENVATTDVYQTKAARMLTESLVGVMNKGTGRSLRLDHTVSAGKTGTTNNKKDGWFVGFTPYYTTSVWVGYDMPKSVSDLTGSSYPGRIWKTFMNEIHDSSMKDKFQYTDWREDLEVEEPTEVPTEEPTETPTEEPTETPTDELTPVEEDNTVDEEDEEPEVVEPELPENPVPPAPVEEIPEAPTTEVPPVEPEENGYWYYSEEDESWYFESYDE